MSTLDLESDEYHRRGGTSRRFHQGDAPAPAVLGLLKLVCHVLSVTVALIARLDDLSIIGAVHGADDTLDQTYDLPELFANAKQAILISNLDVISADANASLQSFLPGMSFYGAVPIRSLTEQTIALLIVADEQPRQSTSEAALYLDELSAAFVAVLPSRDGSAAKPSHSADETEGLGPVFDECPTPMWIYDTTSLRFLAVNQAALVNYGYSKDEFLSMTLRDIRSRDDVPRLLDTVRGAAPSLQPQIGVWRHFRRDGNLVWVQIASRDLVFDKRPARLVWAHDISHYKELEALCEQKNAILTSIGESLTDVIYAKDPHGKFVYSNPAHSRLLGSQPENVVGRLEGDYVPEYKAFRNSDEEHRIVNTGAAMMNREETAHALDGSTSWLSMSKIPLRDKNGSAIGLVAIGRDVTERRRLMRRLEESEQRYKSLFEQNTDAVFSFDLRGRLISANTSCERIFGYSVAELLERSFYTLISQEHVQIARQHVEQASFGTSQSAEITMVHKSGHRIDVSLTTIPMQSGDAIVGVTTISRDITRRKILEQERSLLMAETQQRAERDPATCLLNHRAFQRRLREEVDLARVSEKPLTVALLDLENFRFFNDAHGHLVGDGVLREVAEVLSRMAANLGYSALSRYGGDEFAMLIPNVDELESQRLRLQLEDCLSGMGYQPPGSQDIIPFRFAVGTAVLPNDGNSTLDLLSAAEGRLRIAKSGGGDERVERLRSNLTRSVEGFSLLDSLITAVDNKDHYTRRHSEDVLAYSLELAQELGLGEDVQHDVQVAALLHDVGKIGIPDHILRKPGALTEYEFQAIKQHPMMGAIMVSAVPGFEGVLDATRHHHERWDGQGYPFGLVGEETPLVARLMAVADAYSAMTTDRPYRRGLSVVEALSRLKAGSGNQWDPKCVSAFMRSRSRSIAV